LVARARAPIAAIGISSAGAWEIFMLSRHARWFQGIEGWFYLPLSRPIGTVFAWTVLLFAATATLAALVWSPRQGPWYRVGLLVAAGLGMLIGFALIENRGLFAIRDRFLHAGHSEFARTAASGLTIHDVLYRYEPLVSSGQLGPFERTKPPGTLLFYVLSERFAHGLLPFADDRERLEWSATFATFTWPVFSMLSLVPLFVLGRAVADTERAIWACSLSIAIPSFLLITMHTDQVLFPLLVNSALACAVLAGLRNDFLIGIFTGILGYVAVFCSFGLVAALPLLLACVLIGAAANPTSGRSPFASSCRTCVALAVGAATSWATASATLGYDVRRRYEVAIRAHVAWKAWTGTGHEVRHFAWVNSLEFALWIGAPIAVLLIAGSVLGFEDAMRSRRPTALFAATTLAATIVALAWFGRTKAESARLWLFLAQPACLAASLTLQQLFPRRGRMALGAVWLTQFVIILDMKRFQDFW
jgi:hypothetical protein